MRHVIHLATLSILLSACGGAQMAFAPGALSGRGMGGGSASMGSARVSYTRDALPIFRKTCAACHGAGRAHPKDWTDYRTAFQNRDLIFQRVVTARTMPLGIPMSDADREVIAEWIKSGALDAPVENPAPKPAPADPAPAPADPAPTPAPAPTLAPVPGFAGAVRNLFVNRCSMCHGQDRMNPNDWTDYATASARKDVIYFRVLTQGDMPMGAPLTDEEKKLIRAWIEGGAKK